MMKLVRQLISGALIAGTLLIPGAVAQTSVGGTILSSTTWDLAGSPYQLDNGNIIIGGGATLTIDPGVEVHFTMGVNITVGQGSFGAGAIVARGTRAQPIRFTRPGGGSGSWDALLFADDAIDAQFDMAGAYIGGSIFEHCIFEFAGNNPLLNGALTLQHSAPLLLSCHFLTNAQRGIDADMANGTGLTPPLLVRESEFRSNAGGGLALRNGGNHEISGCTFTDNSGASGAGAWFESCQDLSILTCGFQQNNGTGEGGGMFLHFCVQAQVVGSTFVSNTSTNGGGVFSSGCQDLDLVNCTLNGNASTFGGGGLYMLGGSGSLVQCEVNGNNTGSVGGGGAYFASLIPFSVTDTQFLGNSSGNFGGGVRQDGGNVAYSACSFLGNDCGTDGGGLYTRGIVTLESTTLACNTAGTAGGGLYIANTQAVTLDGNAVLATHNTFQGNSAPQGDAIYLDRIFNSTGINDIFADYVCWGPNDPTAAAPNRIWDFFDDPTHAIVLVSNSASCTAMQCSCEGINYCVTTPNSVGPGAVIGYSGSTSIVSNNLVLRVSGCPAEKPGLFFYGPSQQPPSPLSDGGMLCVAGSLTRLMVHFTDIGGMASHSLDYGLPVNTQIMAGTSWNFQFWFRDQVPGVSGANLSDGLEVFFCD